MINKNDVPVVAGQCAPLLSSTMILCPEIHGHTGLNTCTLNSKTCWPPLSRSALNKNAVVLIAEVILAQSSPVYLVATGPLTNFALVLTLFPEVCPHVAEIVLMGGAIGRGNVSPAAEFNIECDPEAAKIVLVRACPSSLPSSSINALQPSLCGFLS